MKWRRRMKRRKTNRNRLLVFDTLERRQVLSGGYTFTGDVYYQGVGSIGNTVWFPLRDTTVYVSQGSNSQMTATDDSGAFSVSNSAFDTNLPLTVQV